MTNKIDPKDQINYLRKGSASYSVSFGVSDYRRHVRNLQNLAKEHGIVLDIRTVDHGETMELAWRTIDHVKCLNCDNGIVVGDQLVEVYILSKIPLDYREGSGMEVEKTFIGYRHLKCNHESIADLLAVMPQITGM